GEYSAPCTSYDLAAERMRIFKKCGAGSRPSLALLLLVEDFRIIRSDYDIRNRSTGFKSAAAVASLDPMEELAALGHGSGRRSRPSNATRSNAHSRRGPFREKGASPAEP